MVQSKAKNIKPMPQPLTEEQRLAALSRGFTQQFNSIAQGVLFNLAHGYAASGNPLPKPARLVDEAITITESFMEEVGPACDNAFDLIVVHHGIPEDEREKPAEK